MSSIHSRSERDFASDRDFSSMLAHRLDKIRSRYEPFNSLHEAFAVLLEEIDELKEWVWMKQQDRKPVSILDELIDIAAVVKRMASDCLENCNTK